METILIVEDDRTVQKALKRLFEYEGYKVEVSGDGQSALERFRVLLPTAIILDLGLPVVSGKDVCREIRRQSRSVSIIVVSALVEDTNKVLLLELGADDYVTKPFSPRELLARVRSAIRHCHREESIASKYLEFGAARVDFAGMEATFNGEPIALTASEFRTLKFLMENAQRIVDRHEILNQVLGYESCVETRTIDNHILKLRQKLEREPKNPRHIVTVRGMGYKFVP
jgi:two-component system, OmpR family, alkaline phosphatase synthesis response regulator PhoP